MFSDQHPGQTWREPANAPADPWNGATLEWSIPSPPQEFNFAEIPAVQDAIALWEPSASNGGPLPEPPRVSGAGIHLPDPSYWPLVTAVGVLGVIFSVADSLRHDKAGAWHRGRRRSRSCSSASIRWAFEPAG